MENLQEESLEITIVEDNNKNIITWHGRSDTRQPFTVLTPYFDGLIESLKGKDLEIDFKELEYINSETVPPIVQFLKKLNTNSIKTLLIYNKNSKLQAASFKAIETISANMKFLEIAN
ncbi:MAG: hypothetical protein GY754_37335 [bacterium]|nr:hypothetical protein [bacterium]